MKKLTKYIERAFFLGSNGEYILVHAVCLPNEKVKEWFGKYGILGKHGEESVF